MRRARRNLYALKRERREKREYTMGSRPFLNRIGYTLIPCITRGPDKNVSKYTICMIWMRKGGNLHLRQISSSVAFAGSQNAPK